MPLLDGTAPRDVIDCIRKVQDRQMKLAGMLHSKPGEGATDADIVVRIKGDAPVLKPLPANPVL